MCEIQSKTFMNQVDNENFTNEDSNDEVFKCRECNTISYKRLMCDCNNDKAKEYMDNNPQSRLSLNLVKCYKCSNCWHGYKRCDCDSLEDTTEEENTEEELDNDSDYNKHYFDDYFKCSNCGKTGPLIFTETSVICGAADPCNLSIKLEKPTIVAILFPA